MDQNQSAPEAPAKEETPGLPHNATPEPSNNGAIIKQQSYNTYNTDHTPDDAKVLISVPN